MTHIRDKRLQDLDALMRAAHGKNVAKQIHNDLGDLLIKAESHILPQKGLHMTNRETKTKELVR